MQGVTKQNIIVTSLIIATFLTAIEGTIVSTAMPKIVEDLGGSSLYTWVISVYLLATVISTPIFGKLADLYGRKIMFQIGVVIFLLGSTSSGLSQTMEQLVIFRLIQGIGAGALATIPMTIIGDVFSFEQRAKIQGWISSVWGISGVIGPIVGGFIVDAISWHWIFFIKNRQGYPNFNRV
ncbi:MFS transporter [Caldifermentibacillus hisashii]|uniref:MFS transporter n=1 Tax=Caldifermentibacillus hisashii TaxID=996558 RepID=UPI002E1FE10F|nr:MFS transporter [Caldifermentibacillus hisashii]